MERAPRALLCVPLQQSWGVRRQRTSRVVEHMSRPWLASLCLAVILAIGACAGRDAESPPLMTLPAAPDTWLVALENDSIRVTVDTTGWQATAARTTHWIGINDISTPSKRQSVSPSFRFETRQELDCSRRVARGLNMRTPDSTGALFISPVRDSSWQPFVTARLPALILKAVCDRLATVRP